MRFRIICFCSFGRLTGLIVVYLFNRCYFRHQLAYQIVYLLFFHPYALFIVDDQTNIRKVVDSLLIFEVFILTRLS